MEFSPVDTGMTLVRTTPIDITVEKNPDKDIQVNNLETAALEALAARLVGDIPQEEINLRAEALDEAMLNAAAYAGADLEFLFDERFSEEQGVWQKIIMNKARHEAAKTIALDTYAFEKQLTISDDEALQLLDPILKMIYTEKLHELDEEQDMKEFCTEGLRNKAMRILLQDANITFIDKSGDVASQEEANFNAFIENPAHYLKTCHVDIKGNFGVQLI